MKLPIVVEFCECDFCAMGLSKNVCNKNGVGSRTRMCEALKWTSQYVSCWFEAYDDMTQMTYWRSLYDVGRLKLRPQQLTPPRFYPFPQSSQMHVLSFPPILFIFIAVINLSPAIHSPSQKHLTISMHDQTTFNICSKFHRIKRQNKGNI